ncbi:MAG: NAD(P)-binding protein [Candidatus Omnitrophica bacterium]|nr:NAD(P)-binding protein [Candidatus Omnitrophota bacterium]
MNPSRNSKSYECCIIGAGPAGLGAALELVKHGVTDIVIIDKNKTVGGLARTDILDSVRFDIGPHRFFTRNKEVNKIWHDTLGEDFRSVSRLTRIFYKKRYFNYPLKPSDIIIKLGLLESLDAIFGFIVAQISRKNETITFEDWIIRKFGRKLYETFFKAYTEKVWGIPCNQISAEWAVRRIKGLDALEIIKNSLWGSRNNGIKTLASEFDYPVLGAGQMYNAICDRLLRSGAQLMLDSRVVRFNRKDNIIQSVDILQSDGGEIGITAKQFFSSVPLAHFFQMLEPEDASRINAAAGALKYRDHITVELQVAREAVFPDQWIYIHSPDMQITRIANYNNFSRAMSQDNRKTALSAEYFVFKDLGLWSEPDKFLIDLAAGELEEMGLIKKCEIEKAWVVREPEAYPIYQVGFQEQRSLLKSRVEEYLNFYSIGRAGMHKYDNQDHALMSGISASRNYLKSEGSPYAL